MRYTDARLTVAALLLGASPAAAAPARDFAVPPGRLANVIVDFGVQAGISIGIADPRLGQLATPGVRGRLSPRAALKRLLIGTGATFDFVDPGTARVIAAPVARSRQRPAPVIAVPGPPPAADMADIVVIASKQSTSLDRYAGSVDVLILDAARNARSAARGTAAILSGLSTIASTNLGPGRDKLFIRGVADSSFNGPTQATVGQYLGDARLTYNAPDPDLNLYDIERVEVLPGPQGTLYGTGALGGIIRLVPNMPDAEKTAGSASAGVATTRFGGTSTDLAAMLNVPLLTDRLAVRIVGYRVSDAGYIDDPARGASDVNRVRNTGGRVSLRYEPGNDWIIDAGGVYQDIAGRDGQYTLRGQPALTRSTSLAQPFDNDYRLGELRVAKRWQDFMLVSSTSLVSHNVETRYDATTAAGGQPRLYDETIGITLLSHETRLSGRRNGADDWVIGLSLIRDTETQRRRLGDPADPSTITGVRNNVTEAAVFGQYTLALTPRFSATAGGRITYAAADGNALDNRAPETSEPKRHDARMSPTLALSWRPAGKLLLFVHYQEAARAGGLAVAPSASALNVQRFESDTLGTLEAGARFGVPGRDRLAASATVFYARWTDIQADLIDAAGLPFTVNIGDGRIAGIDARVTWRPVDPLTLEVSGFLNTSALKHPAPAFASADERELPNVAEAGARAAVSYRWHLSAATALDLDASLRYVGRSQLGIGPPLDVSQGDYSESNVGARLSFGKAGISLDIINVADVRGNRFAFGNPFGIGDRNQITPLRPRTIRLGLDASF